MKPAALVAFGLLPLLCGCEDELARLLLLAPCTGADASAGHAMCPAGVGVGMLWLQPMNHCCEQTLWDNPANNRQPAADERCTVLGAKGSNTDVDAVLNVAGYASAELGAARTTAITGQLMLDRWHLATHKVSARHCELHDDVCNRAGEAFVRRSWDYSGKVSIVFKNASEAKVRADSLAQLGLNVTASATNMTMNASAGAFSVCEVGKHDACDMGSASFTPAPIPGVDGGRLRPWVKRP